MYFKSQSLWTLYTVTYITYASAFVWKYKIKLMSVKQERNEFWWTVVQFSVMELSFSSELCRLKYEYFSSFCPCNGDLPNEESLLPSARSCGKVMFLHLSVILFRGVWQTPPWADIPPGQTPSWADTSLADPRRRRPLQRTVRILLECNLV